jgi:hypothetical protein
MKRFWIPAFVVMLAGALAAGQVAGQAVKPASKNPGKAQGGQGEQAEAAKAALPAAQVPVAVRQAFQAKFPTVKTVSWTLKSDKNYEAEYLVKGAEVTVKFDPTGKWLETESAIPASQVPEHLRQVLATRFSGYKVIETQTMQKWDDPALIYEIHLENAKEILKALFHADGALLSQSAKPKAGKK